MPDRLLIFANPIAGRGLGRALAEALAQGAERAGFRAVPILDKADTCRARIASELADGATAIATVGGDGTLRGVVTQLLHITDELPPMLVIPLGTANLMARHLGISSRTRRGGETMIDRAVAMLRRRNTRALDVANCNDKPFLLMAGAGLDGAIIHELDRVRRGPITKLSYVLPSLSAWTNYGFPPTTVYVDDRRVTDPEPAMVFVGNIREYGTGFPIIPQATPDDGLLDVCVAKVGSFASVPLQLARVATRLHQLSSSFTFFRGTHVRIEAESDIPIQLDGEAEGFTPAEITMRPSRLKFFVP